MSTIIIGISCLLLSQVRSLLLMSGISVGAIVAVLVWKRELAKVLPLSLVIGGVVFGGGVMAITLGHESVTNRLETLVEASPEEVFYRNRGHYLEQTLDELLPQYPLGAGLGRWGMAYAYFGESDDPDRGVIFAEIQWTGWLLDGGIPLILAYVTAVLLAVHVTWGIAWSKRRATNDTLRQWGTILFGYNVGVLAILFNYPFFIGQYGLEFWLLNVCLFSAARAEGQGTAAFHGTTG
jgi:prolipoprotein diacylglyceryltransferase